MGHSTVLVVGEDFRNQLDKYQHLERTHGISKYAVNVNVSLTDARAEYEGWASNNKKGFVDWVRAYYGTDFLPAGSEPDLETRHKFGWIRLNANGEIFEIIRREIPQSFLDHFEQTANALKLKPGAQGIVAIGDVESPAREGYAGSARKSSIDLEDMQKAMLKAAGDRWDAANSVSGSHTWKRFDVIWEKYQKEHRLRGVAEKEWAEQLPVKAILSLTGFDSSRLAQMGNFDRWAHQVFFYGRSNPSEIDLLGFPRDKYLRAVGTNCLRRVLGFTEVIMDGQLLMAIGEENQFFNSIPDSAPLTLAVVHC
jgi:hypothetical protein